MNVRLKSDPQGTLPSVLLLRRHRQPRLLTDVVQQAIDILVAELAEARHAVGDSYAIDHHILEGIAAGG